MAFCTSCGKSLEEGTRFCTNCGTPAQAAASPTSAAPVTNSAVSAAPAPAALAPAPQPQVAEEPPGAFSSTPNVAAASAPDYTELPITRQSSVSPFFVIVCVVLLLLIGGGIAGTVYLQNQGKAKAQQESGSTSMPSPASPISAPVVADSVRAMNLGNYPGATPVAIATLTGETVVAGFLTRDTPQQVIQFYKVRFPVSSSTASEGRAELKATLPGGANIRIQAEPQGANTQVMILQEN